MSNTVTDSRFDRALVVESRARRKKSRGGVGIFQFAQTVEQDAWEDEQRRKDLQVSRVVSGSDIIFSFFFSCYVRIDRIKFPDWLARPLRKQNPRRQLQFRHRPLSPACPKTIQIADTLSSSQTPLSLKLEDCPPDRTQSKLFISLLLQLPTNFRDLKPRGHIF